MSPVTLSDQSDVALWGPWAWVAFVALASVVFLVVVHRDHRASLHTPPTPAPEVDVHYLSGWECWVAYCDRTASRWVTHPVAGYLFVCDKCKADGHSHGWWVRPKASA